MGMISYLLTGKVVIRDLIHVWTFRLFSLLCLSSFTNFFFSVILVVIQYVPAVVVVWYLVYNRSLIY
jgi:hypothetical protein